MIRNLEMLGALGRDIRGEMVCGLGGVLTRLRLGPL